MRVNDAFKERIVIKGTRVGIVCVCVCVCIELTASSALTIEVGRYSSGQSANTASVAPNTNGVRCSP
jgi:hypothetical protein